MLGLDTAFGRDGVAAFKQALAGLRPNVKVVAEEYAAGNTADFAPFAERLFNALKDKPGKKVIGFIWAGPHPMAKFVDMKPERFGIELAPGGNILPVMNGWKQFAGTEGGIYYYYDFPKNPMNDWLKAEYQKRFNAPPDFFVAGGFAAASAVVAALQKAGSTDTEKLIAAMEGLTFDTPKGTMTFRKEDHQALQDMYHWRIKKDAKDNDLLELVATIPAKDMPLPIRNEVAWSCRGSSPASSDPRASALAARWIPATSAGMTPESGMPWPSPSWRRAVSPSASAATWPSTGVSAAFHAGTLTAIVGPNGAGKTTYFNLISGQLPASAGRVLLDGVEITALGRGARAPSCGIGRAFQLTNLFPNLTVHENVRLAVQARAGGGADIFVALEQPARLDRARRPVPRGGQPRRQARHRRPWPCRTATSASSRWRS